MKSTTHRLAFVSSAALVAALSGAHAATYTWTGATNTTWNTSAANWNDSVTNPTAWVNGTENTAVFNGFASATTITTGTNLVLGTLSTNATNGTGTISFSNAFSIDVTNIDTTSAAIDMASKLTGNHGLNYSSTGGGRLNLKTAADYTGNTVLSGSAYLNIDGTPNNILPTATQVTLNTGTTMRFGRNASASHQIAALSGAGTVISQSGTSANANVHTLKIGTSSANTTQTFTGALNNTFSSLALEISGDGTQIIGGSAKNFAGPTTISGGTLVLGTNLTNSSAVNINGGALRSNVSNVTFSAANVSFGSGRIEPNGTSVGSFTLGANKTFTSTGGTLNFDVGTTFDRIIGSGSGTFSLTGTLLDLRLGTGFAYTNTYQIFSGFSSGSISGLSITGYDTASWSAALSNAGLLSFSAAAVPEPSSAAALAGLGALGLVALRRRR